MSGAPSPEKVKEFCEVLERLTSAHSRMDRKVKMLSELEFEIHAHKEEFEKASGRLLELMGEMDIRSPGNAGWEKRILWFFQELQRQKSP